MARWLSANEACALAMGLSADQPLPPLLLRVMKNGALTPWARIVSIRDLRSDRRVQGEVCRPLIQEHPGDGIAHLGRLDDRHHHLVQVASVGPAVYR